MESDLEFKKDRIIGASCMDSLLCRKVGSQRMKELLVPSSAACWHKVRII